MPTFGGIGFGGGGVAWASFNEGSSTNATFSTITVSGKQYRLAAFTNTAGGSLVISKAGIAELLVVGAGGSGASGGGFTAGGGGGAVKNGIFQLDATTYTIQVGVAGGAIVGNGASKFGSVLMCGAGQAGSYASGPPGASNSSSAGAGALGAEGATVWGIATSSNVGGGAGSTLYGASTTSGISSSITGTAVEYGMGGASGVAAVYGNGGYTTAQQGVVYARVQI